MSRALLLSSALLLAACTATGPRGSNRVDQAAVDAIHAELAQATAQADEGLARHAEGELAAARGAIDNARARFTALGTRCAATPGCEIERVLGAQDAFIERQAAALLGSEARSADVVEAAGIDPALERSPVTHALPAAGRAVALLNGRDLRQVITMNDAVKAAIEEWLTWMRPNLLEAWENYAYLRHRMWPVYEKAGLPEALLFGILAKESGGKVHAVSRAGASGPLQFMPHTGLRYGLGRDAGFDTRFDPTEATRANVAYLNDQFRILGNDLELALGAYNGGEGRMQRLSRSGARKFWDPGVYYALPPETRDYVPMVLAAAWLFLHPEEYGLVLPPIDGRPAEIALAAPQSLNEVAVCLGQTGNERGWFRTLRNLNPRFDPNLRLAQGTTLAMPEVAASAYRRQCQGTRLAALARELNQAKAPAPSGGVRIAAARRNQTHVVRRGETLTRIARKFGCGVGVLASANRLKGPAYAIREGQRLVVPSCRSA